VRARRAEGVDLGLPPPDGPRGTGEERPGVGARLEDDPASDAAVRDVLPRVGTLQPGPAGHAALLALEDAPRRSGLRRNVVESSWLRTVRSAAERVAKPGKLDLSLFQHLHR